MRRCFVWRGFVISAVRASWHERGRGMVACAWVCLVWYGSSAPAVCMAVVDVLCVSAGTGPNWILKFTTPLNRRFAPPAVRNEETVVIQHSAPSAFVLQTRCVSAGVSDGVLTRGRGVVMKCEGVGACERR